MHLSVTKILPLNTLLRKIGIIFLLFWLYTYFNFQNSVLKPTKIDGIILYCITFISIIFLILRSYLLNNKTNFIVFVFISLYVIEPFYYFVLNYSISYHSYFNDFKYFFETLLFLELFLIVFMLVEVDSIIRNKIQGELNFFFFYSNYLIAVLILIFGKTGYKESSPFNEYFLIFFFVCYYFSGGIKKFKYFLFFLAFIYAGKNLMLGGRIESLQLFILCYILFFIDKISYKKLFLILIIGKSIFSAYEKFRPLLNVNDKLVSESFYLNKDKLRISNEGDVFYASVRVVAMVENEVIKIDDRVESFFYFLISPFFSGKDLPKIQDLSTYNRDSYSTGGGGLLPIFFFVWLGLPGIILIALFITYILRNHTKSNYLFFYTYSILTICSIPRWFAYYPTNLIKLCLIGALYAQFCSLIHNNFILRSVKLNKK